MTATTYTDQQRVEALTRLELNGGNVLGTSRELSIPRSTLKQWRDLAEIPSAPVAVTLRDQAPIMAERVSAKLEAIAFSPLPEDVPVRDQLRALEALGRISGLIVDRREISGPDGGPIQTDVRVLVALAERLERLAGGDGSASA